MVVVSMKLIPPSIARWTSASTSACGSPPITSHICPTPPKVIAPRHSSDTNTPVSASCRYFIEVVYSLLPMPSRRLRPTNIVLALLCLMYLITYVDRVNLATAADAIQRELRLSNTRLGFLQSAFAYPYLLFQIFGGWVGDRFGPRRTLFLCGVVWATATILTGLAGGLTTL